MKLAKINKEKFPLIVITYLNDKPTTQEIDDHVAELKSLYTAKEKMVFINDSRKIKYLPSEVRIKLGNFLKQNFDEIKQYNQGIIFLTNSIVASVFVKGVFLVQKPPYPYFIFTEEEKAIEKANEILRMSILEAVPK